MATKYDFDRSFTNYVHKNLAVKVIYSQLNWVEKEVDPGYLESVDLNDGVDYFFTDKNADRTVSVQERFRESKYQTYNDFTIRFEREYNPHEERKLSEYYKLKADYFVYGTINSSKENVGSATDFIKFAVIDIKKLQQLIDANEIVIDRELRSRTCTMIDGKMHCPINYNKDYSSSFFPVDIGLLKKHHPELILLQKGFN